jgi:Sec-independent protein translocase protein TatA
MFANIGPWHVKGFRSAMNEAEESAEQISDESKDADFDSTPAEEPSKEKDS